MKVVDRLGKLQERTVTITTKDVLELADKERPVGFYREETDLDVCSDENGVVAVIVFRRASEMKKVEDPDAN